HRIAIAEDDRPEGEDVIDVLVAVDVPDVASFRAPGEDWIVTEGIIRGALGVGLRSTRDEPLMPLEQVERFRVAAVAGYGGLADIVGQAKCHGNLLDRY